MKTGQKIPIADARRIAKERGYSQVVIHAFDGVTGIQHVTTYGKTEADCVNAAQGGNAIKKLLKWDETNAKPSRQISREKMQEVIDLLILAIDKPWDDDVANLARFVGIAVVAKGIKKGAVAKKEKKKNDTTNAQLEHGCSACV